MKTALSGSLSVKCGDFHKAISFSEALYHPNPCSKLISIPSMSFFSPTVNEAPDPISAKNEHIVTAE